MAARTHARDSSGASRRPDRRGSTIDHRRGAGSLRLVRVIKVLLVLAVAAWAVLGLVGNVAGWSEARASVAAVTSMSTFAGGSASWRATTDPVVVLAGTLFIILFKAVSASFCLAGAWRMMVALRGDPDTFRDAKTLALAGCMVAVMGLFVGWIVIAEGWFQLWKSDALREEAGQTAFRYGGLIGIIALLAGQRDD